MNNCDNMSVNAVRILSADAIQKANSGHPGLPLGAAPMAFELWARHLKISTKDVNWFNRDRFILSAGHGSALLYSLLHLFGYGDLTIDDLKDFRQLGSKTPGHPEFGHTLGVEATTGPLGAGLSNAVGMAIAEEHLAAVFNKEGFPVVDHYTFALAGDGCIMEGISAEAFSLAGTLGLDKLIVLYDSNNITIEGDTETNFTENVMKRMEAYGFQTIEVADGTDLAAISAAIEAAKADKDRPSFIKVNTVIGYGCPAKAGKANSHGEPLGEENVKALRQTLGWEYDEAFYVPQEVYDNCASYMEAGNAAMEEWKAMFDSYCKAYPEMKALWDKYFDENVAEDLIDNEEFWALTGKKDATRGYSGTALNRLKDMIPSLIGGSADLGPSTKTIMKGEEFISKDNYAGRNIHYGIRELAMTGMANGILLHGGLKTYVSTFFVFSDFMKPMARISALAQLPVIYILTHDSIGVGEDGPTHEPVEQLVMYRSIPNFNVFRPADEIETYAAWYSAVTSRTTPTAIVCSRQSVPLVEGTGKDALKGGYIVLDSEKKVPDAIIIATGSELSISIDAAKQLKEEGVDVRVVSMPCMEIFDRQPAEYKEAVLPCECRKRVAVEALSEYGWHKYTGIDGRIIAMHDFGMSAPGSQLFKEFGFTVENVVATVKEIL
ncbi:MAG: transketolase [Lachnospiraceae bacterium]|nr:transketolase [Lachnospiraceae bacterium]